jgi:hypothetical protein
MNPSNAIIKYVDDKNLQNGDFSYGSGAILFHIHDESNRIEAGINFVNFEMENLYFRPAKTYNL